MGHRYDAEQVLSNWVSFDLRVGVLLKELAFGRFVLSDEELCLHSSPGLYWWLVVQGRSFSCRMRKALPEGYKNETLRPGLGFMKSTSPGCIVTLL
jgi:hypothetical protein